MSLFYQMILGKPMQILHSLCFFSINRFIFFFYYTGLQREKNILQIVNHCFDGGYANSADNLYMQLHVA